MNPHAFDQAIAEAARSLVVGSPSGRLRPSVLARLDQRPAVAFPWMAVPAAAVVLTAVLVSVPAGPLGLPAVPGAASLRIPAAAENPAAARVDVPTVRLTEAVPTPRPESAPVAMATVSEAEAAWQAAAVAPLPEPATLVVSVGQPEAVTLPLLEVRELGTAPLTVAPLRSERAPRLP